MEKLTNPYLTILKNFKNQSLSISRLWNIGEESAHLLHFLTLIKKPKTILEIGTSNGFSTFFLALNPNVKVITIDVEKQRQDLAKQNLQNFDNITYITAKAEDFLKTLTEKIDFLFIDANKPNYIKYIHLCEPLLTNEALVIADNIDSHPETTKAYNDYVRKSEFFTTIHLSLDAGLLISIYNKPN